VRLAPSYTSALHRIAEATLRTLPAVDPAHYELPWDSMHNVAVACARVGAADPATRALAATEPIDLRALGAACVATCLLRLDLPTAPFLSQAEALVDRCEHAGARAHTLAELASVRTRVGPPRSAARHLHAAEALAPAIKISLSIAATIARVHVEAGRIDEALRALDAGPWVSPFPVVHHGAGELRTLAIALAEAGAWQRALQLSDRCLDASADDIDLNEDIRLALARRGHLEDLQAYLRERPIDDDDVAPLDRLLALHGHRPTPTPSKPAPIPSDDPDTRLDHSLRAHDFAAARTWLMRIDSSDDARDHACSRYIDACIDGFEPQAIVLMNELAPFRDPVAQTMDLWRALSKMGLFAYG
jgi:tetratricopeptide (TPR) repeat protein